MEPKIHSGFKKWFTFVLLIIGGGTIFKLSSLKDAFYVPMRDYMNLTNTQIGLALSVFGIVQTVGNFFSIYISDRFSKKILIPIGLIGTGLVGLYLTTFPGFNGILFAWGMLSLFAEVIYWPVLLKAVRLLGRKDEQGRLFSFLEAGRGVVDVIVAYSALAIFVMLGSQAAGLKGAILFFSFVCIAVGVLSFFFLENDEIKLVDENGNPISREQAAWKGVWKALKSIEIWTVSLTIFSVYSVYCGLTYFIPFLKDIYGLPVALVGAYGIINQYGLKIIGGPIGGFLSDKTFKSSAKYIRFAFILSALGIVAFAFLPHEVFNVWIGILLTLGYGAIIFSMRAVFFAPIEEVQVPREISGAAMSIACILGYAPQMFVFTLYGGILDHYTVKKIVNGLEVSSTNLQGYQLVFFTMAGFAVMGIIISSYLNHLIHKKEHANT